jgi:hypothetical protein
LTPLLTAIAEDKFFKNATAQKDLCLRTLHTFAFACLHTSQPEGKVKRVQSPPLYESENFKFQSIIFLSRLAINETLKTN